MSSANSCLIHPTAIISPQAELAGDVTVGPYAVIDGKVKVGAGCVIKGHAYLCGPLTLGRNNHVYPGAIVGEAPQHLKYANEPTTVEIGDGNIFREHVTIHRGTTARGRTSIGNNNFLMAGAHVAHDCELGNNCILANNALLGGHCTVADNVFLSGNSAVHQFSRIGRLALLSGCSGATKDIPPFVMQRGFNLVVGVNIIGMRRAGLSGEQINGVRKAFHIIFRSRLTVPEALARVDEELGDIDSVRELADFLRGSGRGVNISRARRHDEAA